MPPAAAQGLAGALALGALHGPAELLPISSSAHVALVPPLFGRPAPSHAVAVALHAGTAAGLAWALRGDVRRAVARAGPGAGFWAAALGPPALAGLMLERRIDARFGTPAGTAAGLLAGAALLAGAELAGAAPTPRRSGRATTADGMALGLAQAAALWPGVSRSGATLAAALLRGFGRADAHRLSRLVGLPVLAGAGAVKAARLVGRAGGGGRVGAAAAAAGASAALFGAPVARSLERVPCLWPFAVERAALAAAVLAVPRGARPRRRA